MRTLLEQLFGRMPREFATPQRRVVESMDKLVALVDQHNGLTKCYVSAYAFAGDEMSYGDVVINKAIFDFDDAWGGLVRTHEWLEERGAAHLVVFSGSDRSGHIYVLAEPTTHQQSLEHFQRDVVIDGAGLRECKRCGNAVSRDPDRSVSKFRCPVCEDHMTKADTRLTVDPNLVGDPATMIRIPNTYHTGAERFCVPLKPDEVTGDIGAVYELAQSQRDLGLPDLVCGDRPVDIAQRAERAEELYQAYADRRRLPGFDSDAEALGEFEAEVAPVDVLESLECTCMSRMVTDGDGYRTEPALGHQHRRVLITHLVERGFNPAEINKFLAFALDDEKAKHSIAEEEQAIRLYRDGVRAPNAVTLKDMGLWRQDCPVHAKAAAEVSR